MNAQSHQGDEAELEDENIKVSRILWK